MTNKRKRIYYVPGMISLILLPILCVWFLKKNYHEERYYEERCMQIALPPKDYLNYSQNSSAVRWLITFEDMQKMRTYTTFRFNGNDDDKMKLDSSAALLKQIIFTEDTINGVHFVLGDGAKYGTFIEILDLCSFTDSFPPKYWVVDESGIWYMHKKKSEEVKEQKREQLRFYREQQQFEKNYNDSLQNTSNTPSKNKYFNTLLHDIKITKMKYFFVIFLIFSIISIFYTWYNFIKKR